MRHLKSVITLVTASVLALPALAFAQEPREGDDGDSPQRPAAGERILRAFDHDGDGRLNEEERAAVREELGERFNELRGRIRELRDDRDNTEERDGPRRREGDGNRDREERPRAEGEQRPEGDRGPDGRRGPDDRPRPEARRDADQRPRDGDSPREIRERVERRVRMQLGRGPEGVPGPGRRGPLGPLGGPRGRDLEALFGWFDTDGDNMLSRGEFTELSQFVERRRAPRPDGPPGPARLGRRGPNRLMSPQEMMGILRGGPQGERFERFRLERDERRREGDRSRGESSERGLRREDPPRPRRPGGPPGPPESDRNPPDAI